MDICEFLRTSLKITTVGQVLEENYILLKKMKIFSKEKLNLSQIICVSPGARNSAFLQQALSATGAGLESTPGGSFPEAERMGVWGESPSQELGMGRPGWDCG